MEHRKRTGSRYVTPRLPHVSGEVLTPLSNAARVNPFTMFENVPQPDEIALVSGRNRMVGDPHLKSMVAKDGVNQSAAVLVMSFELASELGLADKAVFLRGFAEASEQALLERADLSTSPALRWAYDNAVASSGLAVSDIEAFDLYSCFPVAVIEAMETLGIDTDDHRPTSLDGRSAFLRWTRKQLFYARYCLRSFGYSGRPI